MRHTSFQIGPDHVSVRNRVVQESVKDAGVRSWREKRQDGSPARVSFGEGTGMAQNQRSVPSGWKGWLAAQHVQPEEDVARGEEGQEPEIPRSRAERSQCQGRLEIHHKGQEDPVGWKLTGLQQA